MRKLSMFMCAFFCVAAFGCFDPSAPAESAAPTPSESEAVSAVSPAESETPDEESESEISFDELIETLTLQAKEEPGILGSVGDLRLESAGTDEYTFVYGGESFAAVYTDDNWKIIDSYRITAGDDMKIICSALIAIRPIHTRDMSSFRTPDDMADEWIIHNIAYKLLPDDNVWKQNAKDVDLDPADEGLDFYQIAAKRMGK